MQLQQKEDDELFFVIVPTILQCLNDEKRPIHTSEYTSAKKMKEILEGHESWCKPEFCMEPEIFKATCNYLRREGLLRDTRRVIIEEQLGLFLFMISHNGSNERLKKTFQHSVEKIVHMHIKVIFNIIPTLTHKCLKLPSSN
jgi:glucose-6-phosphate 1-dehydrogenase